MFTSNGKIYCKRDSGLSNGHARMAGMRVNQARGYDEDFVGQSSGRTGLRNEGARFNYDEEYFERRNSARSNGSRVFDEDILDQRGGARNARNGSSRVFDEDNLLDRKGGIRNGVGRGYDEESLLGSDHAFANQPVYGKTYSNSGQQTFGNQLLNLRAALNEKELQLVELREQHISVVNRAGDARQNWEEALKSKDRVILQLQKALHHKRCALERQERDFRENVYRALQQRQKEEHTEVEKKELKIALLEAKNAQFVQELVEQQKLITKLKRQQEEKEKYCASHVHKMEMMNGRVQDLKAALQDKEEVAETKSKYCNELKTLLWKRDSMIAQLQLAEQQLQSTLARQEAAYEALVVFRDKLQEEKCIIEKKLVELRNQFGNLEGLLSRSSNLKGHPQNQNRKPTDFKDDCGNGENSAAYNGGLKDFEDREGLDRQHKRIRELQRALRVKDTALITRTSEHQRLVEENHRLMEEYETLKQEYEELSKRNNELEVNLARLQDQLGDGQTGCSVSDGSTPPVEVLPYEFYQRGSTGEDLGLDEVGIMDSMESEQVSNASVYHANFEKIKIVEVETPNIEPKQPPAPPPPRTPTPPPPRASPRPPTPSPPPPDEIAGPPSEADNTLNSIQDEILKREKCWRKTEELMRAALTRRMKLLEEAKEVHQSEEISTDRRKHVEVERQTDRQKQFEHENKLDRRKQMEDDSSMDYRRTIEQLEARKQYEPDGHRNRRKIYEQDNYLDRRNNYDVETYRNRHDQDKSRRQYDQGTLLDRRKNYQDQYEHYGHYERSGHGDRAARLQRGKY